MRNFTIAAAPGSFCGWSANNGLARCWGDELTVPFVMLPFVNKGDGKHAVSRLSIQELCVARSMDGGATWATEHTGVTWPYRSYILSAVAFDQSQQLCGEDTSLLVSYESANRGNSGLRISSDRGRTWGVPLSLPEFDRGVCGRTDYVAGGKATDAMFLFTVPSRHVRRGRLTEGTIIAARTTDGGVTWAKVADVGRDPIDGFSIMPSTVRCGRMLVTALRVMESSQASIEVWGSADEGLTWSLASVPCEWPRQMIGACSSPASLVALRDGRLALTYNDRNAGRACAKLSDNTGLSWGEEIVLRAEAGNWDIGYIRSVEMASGEVLSAYYWNDYPDRERYIAGTIWRP